MSLNRHKLAIGVLAALMHQSGWAQPAATASLLEQGRYWQNPVSYTHLDVYKRQA